jgi:3-deoxy-D-manno-octulosonic-acid transferase
MTILLTTGTLTSAKLLTTRLPKSVIHQFAPLDRPAWVQTFLNHWSPNLVLIMESEFWPTQIQQIKNRDIPIIIVNARLSKRSYARWQWTRKMSRSIFGNLDLVIATNPEQAQRFINLGAPCVEVGGNLKRSAAKLSLNKKSVAEISKQVGGRKIWLAASTHEGEDLTVIRAQKLLQHQFPDLLTIIVPRHPKRGSSIQRLGKQMAFVYLAGP